MTEEYEYVVTVAGAETFANLMSKQGVNVESVGGGLVKFSSERLIDMKGLKAKGIIRAYKIARVKRVEELVEEG